jgi:hypothetical protein
MRVLVSHPHWRIPIAEAAVGDLLANHHATFQVYGDPEGKRHLMLWSSDDAFSIYAKSAKVKSQHFLDTTGTYVFQQTSDLMDEVWIDPYTEYQIRYGKEHFAKLRELAAAVEIEDDLSRLRQGTSTDGAVNRVREYAHYIIGMTGDEKQQRLLLAPDHQGRDLAAVFTAEDAFEAFASSFQGAGVVKLPLKGVKLFSFLMRISLTGIVFNCAGPPAPVAFASAFFRTILGDLSI